MRGYFRLALLVLLVAVIITVGILFHDDLDIIEIKEHLLEYGKWTPIIFIVVFIVWALLALPASILAIVGGLLFGPALGVVFNLTGAICGAIIVFLLSRYLAYDWVSAHLGKHVRPVMIGIKREGWKFIAILRLMPIMPYGLINYGSGLTPVKFSHYLIASVLCLIPGTLAYTYIGSLGEAMLKGDTSQTINQGLIVLGLIVTLACIPWLIRHLRETPPSAQDSD